MLVTYPDTHNLSAHTGKGERTQGHNGATGFTPTKVARNSIA